MAEYEQAVFISYAWGSERESIVNEIDESLQQRGIRIIRDKRALGYRGSIKEFMERIGRGSCIIVVISDKYLRSSNCMFELVEIAENKQFHDRVFPVVLGDANIYDPVKRIEYVKHWEAKRKELAKAMKGVDPANLHGIREEMDNYDRIRDRVSGITSLLKDMNTLTPDMHRDSEFSNLYDAIVERLKEGATDVTAEFNEIAKKGDREAKAEADLLAAQKAEEERLAQAKADADRKAKEEAVRVASQKAEADRLAAQKAEEERLSQAKAETDRIAAQKAEEDRVAKAKAETDRLAAEKAEAERKAKEKVAPIGAVPVQTKAETVSAVPQKKSTSKGLIVGVIAVVAIVVCAIAGLGLRAIANSGTPAAQAPAVSNPPTAAPVAQVNGQNVTYVQYDGGGQFMQTGAQSWTETGVDNTEYYFSEDGRDEWSVYLIRDDGLKIHIDLYEKQIFFDNNDGNGEQFHSNIIDAR